MSYMLHRIKQLFDFVHVKYAPFYKAPHTTGHHVIRIVNETNLLSKKMYSSYIRPRPHYRRGGLIRELLFLVLYSNLIKNSSMGQLLVLSPGVR